MSAGGDSYHEESANDEVEEDYSKEFGEEIVEEDFVLDEEHIDMGDR